MKFKELKELVEGKEGKRSDNGGENTLREFSLHLPTNHIHHQFTCANKPQRNGVVERKYHAELHVMNV